MSPSRFVAAVVLAAVGPDASAEPGPMPREIRLDSFGAPLPEGAVLRLGTTRLRHGQWVRSVGFSPDGRELVSASFDGTVRIWDRATGKELRRLKESLVEPQFVAFTHDGRQVITTQGGHRARDEFPVRLWDAKTGEPVRKLAEKGPRSAAAAALSPDGRRLAWGDQGGVAVLDLGTSRGARWFAIDGAARVSHVTFAPDSDRLAAGYQGTGGRPEVAVYDLTGAPAPAWRTDGKAENASGTFPAAAFSSDGKHLLVSFNYKEQPVLLDAETGKVVRRLDGPHVAVAPFRFLPGGDRVFTNTWGGGATVWDVSTGKPAVTGTVAKGDFVGAALSPEWKTVAIFGQGAIRLWDAATLKPALEDDAPLGDVGRLEFLPGGRRVLVGSYWDQVCGARVWDLETGRAIAAFPGSAASATLLSGGKTFAVGYYHGTPDVADSATGKGGKIGRAAGRERWEEGGV